MIYEPNKTPRRRGKGDDGLSAYYYHFDSTGCELVDRILQAMAGAGATSHNTDEWGESYDQYMSPRDSIQLVAQEVADEFLRRELGK